MSRPLSILILASLLSCGCRERSQPTAEPAPPTPSTAPPAQALEAAKPEPAAAPARQVECRGGEVVATWQSAASDDGKIKTATLSFAAAGHRAWSYDFAYEGGVLASARHRISSWSFAGGDVDHPKTHDKAVERRYALEAGKLVSCTERRAQGSGDAIEQLVQDASAKDIPCEQGAPVVALAEQAAQPYATADTAWLATACESDTSSGLKL
jgi:hypothetical protein